MSADPSITTSTGRIVSDGRGFAPVWAAPRVHRAHRPRARRYAMMPADLAQLDDDRRRRLYVALYAERFGRTPDSTPEYVPETTARTP